jgi:hypothetical protein
MHEIAVVNIASFNDPFPKRNRDQMPTIIRSQLLSGSVRVILDHLLRGIGRGGYLASRNAIGDLLKDVGFESVNQSESFRRA